jgi:plastocyanin
MHQAALPLLASSLHEKSKTAFYIAAIVLVAWAAFVSFNGFRRAEFPGSPQRARLLIAVSIVFVAAAMSSAIVTASTPAPAHPYTKPLLGLGTAQAPPPTPLASAAAPAATTAPHAAPAGTAQLTADPTGQLHYSTPTVSVTPKAGKVTIQFTNNSPVDHNTTLSGPGGAVLGTTPTFHAGTKSFTVALKPGSYQFYCTVPGHRAAGMQGTLTVK